MGRSVTGGSVNGGAGGAGPIDIGRLPEHPRPAEYVRLAREIGAAGTAAGLEPVRLAVLASATFDFAEPFLVVEGARRGFFVSTYFGRFGQFEQEVVEPEAGLRRFGPDALVVIMRPEDLDPDAVARYYATGGRRFGALAEEIAARVDGLIRAVRGWSRAPVLVANLTPPAEPPLGVFDANVPGALTFRIAEANAALRDRVAAHAGAVVWDYAGLVRACGAATWTDRRLWALGRVPVAAAHQPALARHLIRTLAGVKRRPAKCLVLDLDNTLWGGAIGDDGLEGIVLGDDYPGSAYKAFQRAALALRDRGILLAVASKNDEAVARQVFDDHPEMVIRWDDLAAVRIDWGPKSANIRALAGELNLGADALVLFDDNPVERAEVRANAPEVGVIEVPPDPLAYPEALGDSGFFDQASLSDEDRRRASLYREERQRQVLARRFATVEEFLASLEMEAEVGEADGPTLARIAQLVGKTNQFNLTTRRHSQADIDAMTRDPAYLVAWLRLRDRFGDQGLVAVAILRQEGTAGVLDTYLMSCRVMNRRVENALLAYVAEEARRRGCTTLVGEYYPTRKNGMVADFYPRLGFTAEGELEGGGRRFALPLEDGTLPWPDVIARREGGGERKGRTAAQAQESRS